MGSPRVVEHEPVLNHDLGFEHGVELLGVEQLAAHRPAEPFDVAVLLRAGLGNEHRTDVLIGQPLLDGVGDELPPVVRADERRLPVLGGEQPLQVPGDLERADAARDVGPQRDRFLFTGQPSSTSSAWTIR